MGFREAEKSGAQCHKDIGCKGRLEDGKHAEISRSLIEYTQENVVSHESFINDFAGVLCSKGGFLSFGRFSVPLKRKFHVSFAQIKLY